ncbi:alanine:cation symporter family protein, partial [Streptococcus suis]
MVPFMAILYILAIINVLAVHWDQLLQTLALVLKSAYNT